MKLFLNARFYIDGSFNNSIQAILVDRGKIVSLLNQIPAPATSFSCIDLGGACVYPGFTDVHTHSFSGGLYLDGIDLSPATCLQDVFDLISQASGSKDTVFAWRLDESLLSEKRFPTRAELDSVLPHTPILIRRIDGHSCVLNSAALHVYPGLKPQSEVLKGAENDIVVNWFHDNCSAETIINAYHRAAREAMKGGFTTVHTMIGDAQFSLQHFDLVNKNLEQFPIRFVLYPQSFDIKAALENGSTRIGGCILADGSIGSHTAALSEPYLGHSGKGILYQSDDFWQGFVSEAHKAGLQICVHCIGDAAIRQINSAYAKIGRDQVLELRHQLIHCEVTPDALVVEIAQSGATPVMQPAFDLLWGGDDGFYARNLGLTRSRQMNRWGSFGRKGIRVCGSSDWYITPLDIGMSIHSLVNHHNPDERVSARAAIRIYTENNAWINHEEHERGLLRPGYIADFSVLNTDLTKDFDYKHVKVTKLVRNGELIYEN